MNLPPAATATILLSSLNDMTRLIYNDRTYQHSSANLCLEVEALSCVSYEHIIFRLTVIVGSRFKHHGLTCLLLMAFNQGSSDAA